MSGQFYILMYTHLTIVIMEFEEGSWNFPFVCSRPTLLSTREYSNIISSIRSGHFRVSFWDFFTEVFFIITTFKSQISAICIKAHILVVFLNVSFGTELS